MTPPSIPDYTFRALIGEGSTGRVFAVEYGGQTPMALKAFDADSVNRQLVSDALVKIFNRDEHPGIVTVHDFDLASEQAYMATSLHGEPYQDTNGEAAIRPRTIHGLMGHLIPEDAWGYAQQIAEALAFLHRQRVIHCNLEPSNVLLDDSTPPHIKLTDFSQGLVGSVPKLIPGDSVFYAAPEQIRQPEHYFGGRAERWDVYAFGVLSYQLLTGQYPRLGAAYTEVKKREAASLNVHFAYDYKVLADMIEAQVAYEWPSPAADDDESARRAIIDRCLEIKAEDRFPDMREVALAFKSIDDEKARREEHRKIAAEQLRSDKEAGGLKKICAALGILALGGLGGAAYFSQKPGSEDAANPDKVEHPSSDKSPAKTGVSKIELEEMKALVETSTENLGESQAALDEIFTLVIARDQHGNPEYNLPEESRGLLLNYYEDFANRHQANPDLALAVAKADSNAGEIHLTLGDAEASLEHMAKAVAKITSLRAQNPSEVRLTIAAAQITHNLSEAQALAGQTKASADSAVESNEIWTSLQQANPTSSEAIRALGDSLLYLGGRLLDIDRPSDTGLHIQRAKTLYKGLEADGELAEEDIVALSRCDHLLGLSERANGNIGDAIDLQIAAVDRLLNVKISNPETPRAQLFLLATYYGELADAVAESGDRQASEIANKEAINLLVDLIADSPSVVGYDFELARRYSTKVALLRDAGEGKAARAVQDESIAILRDLLKVYPKRYDLSFELALQLADLMDLYADSKMKLEVKDTGLESVGLLSDLLNEDINPEENDAKRPRYRLAYGDVLIRFAEHGEKLLGDKSGAKLYFEKGVRQLEIALEAGIGSDADKKLIETAQGRIKALGG